MKKNNIAVLASGTGSNTQKIISYFANRDSAKVSLIICNKSEAGVLQIADEKGIPSIVIKRKELVNHDYVLSVLKDYQIDWIILAGFLLKIPEFLVTAFPNHIINIHPALLPKFGGKGMYGAHVHKAVIEAKEKESGITIHFVNKEYDKGKIILQKKCSVSPDETPETLAEKIHQLEHQWFAKTIEKAILET